MNKKLMDEVRAMLAAGVDPVSKQQELLEKYGKQCAVLVLDSTGFTKTTFKFGIIRALSRLAQKRAMVVPILERNDCFNYITEADSFIALFPDVPHAMEAVLQANHAIEHKQYIYSREKAYDICCGIGYGTLLVTGDHGEFFGPEMNFASKLGEDTAEARELLLTPSAYARISNEKQIMFNQTNNTISGNDLSYYKTTL